VGKRVLYVGGLSESVSSAQLSDLFGSYGVVSRAYVVRHKHSTKSTGYAFVEMASAAEALAAVVALEGALLAGNSLRVYVTPYASQK
jgi:RNA recognition motif-containing protein